MTSEESAWALRSDAETLERAPEDAVEAAASIGPAHRAMEGQDDKTRAAALASIREALLQYARGASVRLGAAIWIVTARAP